MYVFVYVCVHVRVYLRTYLPMYRYVCPYALKILRGESSLMQQVKAK